MTVVRQATVVPLSPVRAAGLWTDLSRWASFVEGFKHVVEVDASWPEAGSKLVWQSIPGGRGRVTERVLEHELTGESARMVSQVFEEALSGRQRVSLEPAGDGADEARIAVELDYELARRGPLRRLVDLLFIRRALSDSVARTLRRFATEAEEEASL